MLDDNTSSQQKLLLQTSGIQTLLSLDLKACRPLNSTKNTNQQKLASQTESQASLHINLNLLNKNPEKKDEILQHNLS